MAIPERTQRNSQHERTEPGDKLGECRFLSPFQEIPQQLTIGEISKWSSRIDTL